MSSTGRRARLVLAWLALTLALAAPLSLQADCTIKSGPNAFDPPASAEWGTAMSPAVNNMALFVNGSNHYVADRFNYGYAVYSFGTNPMAPTLVNWTDLHILPGYSVSVDGQTSVAAVGAPLDGTNLLIGYAYGHPTLVLPPRNAANLNGSFTVQNKEFLPGWSISSSGGIQVDQIGSRYVAYTVNVNGVFAADISSGAPGTTSGGVFQYYSERVTAAPVSARLVGVDLAGNAGSSGSPRYLVYSLGYDASLGTSRIVVVDVTNPGDATSGNLTRNFNVYLLDPSDFGLPKASTVKRVRAAINPQKQTLEILVETNAGHGSTGVAIKTFSPSFATYTGTANTYTGGISPNDARQPYTGIPATGSTGCANAPSAYFSPCMASTTLGSAFIPYSTTGSGAADDLMAFLWEQSSDFTLKLFAFSSNNWGTNGLDLAPQATLAAGTLLNAYVTEGWSDAQNFFLVVGSGSTNNVLKLECTTQAATNAPANPSLIVTDSTGASITQAPIGTAVTVTRNVSPTPIYNTPPTGLVDWLLDFDYHSNTAEGSSSYPFLNSPDVRRSTVPLQVAGVVGTVQEPTSYYPAPPALTFTGPCNPSPTSGAAETRSCWASVTLGATNDLLGTLTPIATDRGPTFAMADEGKQAVGTTFAFAAFNSNNTPANSLPPATVPFKWTVPNIRISSTAPPSPATNTDWQAGSTNLTILSGTTLYDLSEGHPYTTPLVAPFSYKWYFETAPGSNVMGAADPACTGSSCLHDFGGVVGNYGYWVTVPYPNGYISQDLLVGAFAKRGTVNVSNVVLSLTPSQTTFSVQSSGSPSLTVTDHSTRASGATGVCTSTATFTYNLCNTTDTTNCVAAAGNRAFSSLGAATGPWAVSVPNAAGNYLLRINYTYAMGTSSCSTFTTAAWNPPGTTASDPTALPLTVTDFVPGIKFEDMAGNQTYCNITYLTGCPTAGSPFKVVAYNTATGLDITDFSSAYTWSFTDLSPSTVIGSPATVTYPSGGTYETVTLNGGAASQRFYVNAVVTTVPPSISSFTASPSSAAVNQSISFSCSASGTPTPSYSIVYGDGASDTGSSTTHAYGAAGTYTATCTASNSASQASRNANVVISSGQSSQINPEIRININGIDSCTAMAPFPCSRPIDSFSAKVGDTMTAYAYDTRTAQLIPDSAGTFNWTFTGASPGSGYGNQGNNFIYSQATSNTSGVRLVFTQNGGASTTVTIGASIGSGQPPAPTISPEIRINVNGVDPCVALAPLPCDRSSFSAFVGDTMTANAYDTKTNQAIPISAGSFSWSFLGATPGSAQGNPGINFTYSQPQSSTVTLVFTPTSGSATTLTTQATINQVVNPISLQVQASPSSAVVGGPVSFTATTSGGSGTYTSYTWDFGDGTGAQNGTTASTSYTYTRAGTFTVTCTVKDSANRSKSATTNVTVTSVQLWLVPGVAWVSGQDAVWESDLRIFNPSLASPMTVKIGFLSGTAPITSLGDVKWQTVTIAKQATKTYLNVIWSLFKLQQGNYGAVLIQADSSVPMPPVISGSTYTLSPGAAGGTVGLSLSATLLPNGAGVGVQTAGNTADLIGLRDDSNHHSNFAIGNLFNDYVEAEVTFWGTDGTQLGQAVTIQLNPFGVLQKTNALTAPVNSVGGVNLGGAGYDKGANPIPAYRARVRLVHGTAILPYASVIDDNSKDPVLVTGAAIPVSSYRVPGVVRAPGKNNTLWRSDLVIYNPSGSERSIWVQYSWVDGSDKFHTTTAPTSLTPGQVIQSIDFVQSFLGLPSGDTNTYKNAFVDVYPADTNGDPILVTARTYNSLPTGDVGLGVPGFSTADTAAGDGVNKRLILAGLRSDPSFRSNVALFVAYGSSATSSAGATLKVYDASGLLLAAAGIGLIPAKGSSFVQVSIDDILASSPKVPGADTSSLSVVVENLTGAPVSGYATIVDNSSGDGTLIPALPIP
jgi:PKD repeat protein